ncbi:hypothetical protein SAMN02982931_00805 [Bauldia litoralis]|uniref:Uncharacterized protein n=2 Tax=Bauldia litoralis TaxID=665467 RepID=A0A1G6AL42_9HYPH|nr:hypothetical protein SAMN02982931_00805 [Bauldia litoralis]
MAAKKISEVFPDVSVFWISSEQTFPEKVLKDIFSNLRSRAIIFIDNFSAFFFSIERLLEIDTPSVPKLLVLIDRTNIVNRHAKNARAIASSVFTTRKINEEDAKKILEKLRKNGPWAFLGSLRSDSERIRMILDKSNRDLLVGLREATEGRGYDEIVRSDYTSIESEQTRKVFLLILCGTVFRAGISRNTLYGASEYLGIGDKEVNESVSQFLAGMIYQRKGVYFGHHQLLAEYIITNLASKVEVLSCVDALIFSLSRFSPPLRRNAPGAESKLFVSVVNHEFLGRLFSNRRTDVINMLEKYEKYFEADALFLLQMALLEKALGGRYVDRALSRIQMALRLWPTSYQVINGAANIIFDTADAASDRITALQKMEQASDILRDQLEDQKTEAYAAVCLARGRIAVMSKWDVSGLRGEWGTIQKNLKAIQAKHPSNSEVASALRSLPLVVARATARNDRTV